MTEPQGLKHKKGTEQVYHVNFLFDEAKYKREKKDPSLLNTIGW
jgi:hypothetical protein